MGPPNLDLLDGLKFPFFGVEEWLKNRGKARLKRSPMKKSLSNKLFITVNIGIAQSANVKPSRNTVERRVLKIPQQLSMT